MDGSEEHAAIIDNDRDLKPIIKEVVRTQVCFPNLRLLVDRISVITLPANEQGSGNEAYRLCLTDGKKTIQALLKRKIYKTIINRSVIEGSYVILKEYRLAKGKRLTGNGYVVYLVIEDFFAIGEDDREHPEEDSLYHEESSASRDESLPPINLHNEPYPTPACPVESSAKYRDLGFRVSSDTWNHNEKEAEDVSQVTDDEVSLVPFTHASTFRKDKKRKRDPTLQENLNFASRSSEAIKLATDINEIKGGFEGISSVQRSSQTSGTHCGTAISRPISPKRESENPKDLLVNSKAQGGENPTFTTPGARFSASRTPFPQNLRPMTPPLNLVSLSHVSTNPRRNTTLSVFACIHSVSPHISKPPRMPPKRDLRLVDPSTSKKVLLSVFVSPETFLPEVGTVALFRDVVTHEWEGGMLNVYDKYCKGRNWFLKDPWEMEGCDVAGLKKWWGETYG